MPFLIYGTDEGRISENAALLAKNWSKKYGDGGEIIQIDDRPLLTIPILSPLKYARSQCLAAFRSFRAKP